MARQKGTSEKKERITQQQVTEMIRLRRQGYSISAIARSVGCHRQTVSTYLKEKHEDLVGDEARRQVLVAALANHFEQLARFAQVDLKRVLDASAPAHRGRPGPRPMGPISTDGTLGIPSEGGPQYMADEWVRMYNLPPRESYLLASLRQHTKGSPVWIHWDRWHEKVAEYENASWAIREWLERKLEEDLLEKASTLEMEPTFSWLFGSILLAASSGEPVDTDPFKRQAPGEGILTSAYSKDSEISRYLSDVFKQAQDMTEWATLKSVTAELKKRESQQELRRMARELDHALVSIQLMTAFPGRCDICPV